ncbi:MAG: hypothetical protein ACQETI_00005, partial [Halobacteriota archaeon]
MDSYLDELLDTAPDTVDLDGVLQYLAESNVDDEGLVHQSLALLKHSDGEVCLKCSSAGVDLYVQWFDGDL